MIPKRTRTDLILLVIVLLVAAWSWRARTRMMERRANRMEAIPTATPRVQDFMRRVTIDEALSDDLPSPALTPALVDEDTFEDRAAGPGFLVLDILTPDGHLHPGPLEVFTPDGLFVQQVSDGRVALQLEPGRMTLQARFEDEYGIRHSEVLNLQIEQGERLAAELIIPDPVIPDMELGAPGFGLVPGDGYAEVVDVIPDSPAANAGLRPGDAVLSIEGQSVAAMNTETLNGLLWGPPGTPVILQLVIRTENGELEEVEAAIQRVLWE
ncbi:MAG: PDZ domain-containing protein [Verrucomicrobia bacterium]|nr:PDZ domain-containing protein [Verrucomicrobiota bacterium]MCH8510446.1 PDZ domain-containing protein [Kiritimatiellia bacterium]